MKLKRFYYFWEMFPQFLCLCPWIPATDKDPPAPPRVPKQQNSTFNPPLLNHIWTLSEGETADQKMKDLSSFFILMDLSLTLSSSSSSSSGNVWQRWQWADLISTTKHKSFSLHPVGPACRWRGFETSFFFMASSHSLSQKRPHNNHNGLAGVYPPAPLCAFHCSFQDYLLTLVCLL